MSRPVLHVVTTSARRGAETFAVTLNDELGRRGVSGRVVALAPSPSSGGLPVAIVGGNRTAATRSWTTLRALRRLVRSSGPVVAHGSDTLVACAIACIGHPEGFVYRVIGDPAYWSGRTLRRMRVGLLLRRARVVVVLDERWTGLLVRRYGVRSDAVFVAPNAVDGHWAPVTDEVRARARLDLELDPDAPVVAYVGALSDEKDPLAAVRAVLAIDRATLVVAGAGPLAAQLPADERIMCLGSLVDLRPVYAAVDVLIIPSATEGMPAVAIEAGLSGIPVVANDVGAISAVIRDGITGMLVDPHAAGGLEDGLRTVLSLAPGERALMGEAAERWCRAHFTFDAVTAGWASILGGATETQPGR